LISSEVEQRRRDISAYVADHFNVGLNNHLIIADALGLDPSTVHNDITFLRDKLKIDYSQYNIEGLRDKASAHVKRLKELQTKAKNIIDGDNDDASLKAIDTELKLIHNIYQLEQDGIGALTEEIDGLENKEK